MGERFTEPKVSSTPATCYTVRNGGAWAHLYVQGGADLDRMTAGVRHWVNVSVISDYDDFGFCWTHCGGDWRAFLASLDFDYAMNKFMGSRLRRPVNVATAAARARKLVADMRRRGDLDKGDARPLWDAIEDAELTADDCAEFIRRWDDHSCGQVYRRELYDANFEEYSPAALGFWADIWPHFIAAIQAQAAA